MKKLVRLTNPHRDENYAVKETGSDKQIWRFLADPDKIDYISEVVSGENIHTEISIGGQIFEIDCTAEALIDLINCGRPLRKRIKINK